MTRRSKPKRKVRSDAGSRRKGADRLARMVSIRLTEDQHLALEQLASESDSTASDWARDAVLVALESAASVVVPPPPEGSEERLEERMEELGVSQSELARSVSGGNPDGRAPQTINGTGSTGA